MAPAVSAVMMVPSRTPFSAPIAANESTTEMTTMVVSKAILHLGNGCFTVRETASTRPSPGSVMKAAFTCRNTPNEIRKQLAMFQASWAG